MLGVVLVMQLTSSGELDKLKKVLCESLTECGWKEEVRQLCKGMGIVCGGLVGSMDWTSRQECWWKAWDVCEGCNVCH